MSAACSSSSPALSGWRASARAGKLALHTLHRPAPRTGSLPQFEHLDFLLEQLDQAHEFVADAVHFQDRLGIGDAQAHAARTR